MRRLLIPVGILLLLLGACTSDPGGNDAAPTPSPTPSPHRIDGPRHPKFYENPTETVMPCKHHHSNTGGMDIDYAEGAGFPTALQAANDVLVMGHDRHRYNHVVKVSSGVTRNDGLLFAQFLAYNKHSAAFTTAGYDRDGGLWLASSVDTCSRRPGPFGIPVQ